MSISYPTSLDTFTDKQDGVDYPQAIDINDVQDAIEALETKVGVNNSSDTNSIDYKINNFLDVNTIHAVSASIDSITASTGRFVNLESQGVYFVDSSESDQGANGSGRSVKDILDLVGSNGGTIIFSHTGAATTTTYTFSTNTTIPSNVKLQIQQGAIISIDSGITLTMSREPDAGRYQIFSGSGSISGLDQVYPEWFGAVGDNSTDDTTALTKAENSAEKINILRNYKVSSIRDDTKYFGLGNIYVGSVLQPTPRIISETKSNNILPNTQWQVFSSLDTTTKYNKEGTGTLPSINISSYSTGSNLVTCYTSDTSELKDGDLVSFSAAADANMRISLCEVENVVTNTSFQVRLPLGRSPSASAVCTAVPQMRGDISGTSGDGPDGWVKTTTLKCWRDDFDENKVGRSKYQLGLKKGSSSAEYLYHAISNEDLPKLLGKRLAFGIKARHKISTSGYWRAFIQTDSGIQYSVASSGTEGQVEWRELYVDIPNTSTYIYVGIEFQGATDDVIYIAEPIAVINASYLGDGSYNQPKGEVLIPTVKTTPNSFNGASFTFPSTADAAGSYGFAFRIYPETQGAISPDVLGLYLQLESRNDSTNQAFGIRNQEAVPHVYGVLIYSKVAGMMETIGGQVTLKNGKSWVYSNVGGSSVYNVSIDINQVRLS